MEDRVEATVKLTVLNVTPEVRRRYRFWREMGISRYDANLYMAGFAAGSQSGEVNFHIGAVL